MSLKPRIGRSWSALPGMVPRLRKTHHWPVARFLPKSRLGSYSLTAFRASAASLSWCEEGVQISVIASKTPSFLLQKHCKDSGGADRSQPPAINPKRLDAVRIVRQTVQQEEHVAPVGSEVAILGKHRFPSVETNNPLKDVAILVEPVPLTNVKHLHVRLIQKINRTERCLTISEERLTHVFDRRESALNGRNITDIPNLGLQEVEQRTLNPRRRNHRANITTSNGDSVERLSERIEVKRTSNVVAARDIPIRVTRSRRVDATKRVGSGRHERLEAVNLVGHRRNRSVTLAEQEVRTRRHGNR